MTFSDENDKWCYYVQGNWVSSLLNMFSQPLLLRHAIFIKECSRNLSRSVEIQFYPAWQVIIRSTACNHAPGTEIIRAMMASIYAIHSGTIKVESIGMVWIRYKSNSSIKCCQSTFLFVIWPAIQSFSFCSFILSSFFSFETRLPYSA